MRKNFFVVTAAFISSSLLAQQPDSSKTKQLDEVVVTATRYAVKQSETGKVITVITRADLDKSSGETLPEVLNRVAGVSINGANNNLGSVQTVNLRGTSAGNTLILIDGIPVNDPSVITNYFDLNLLVADQIERIEILKGGQSTLYGSDAVAGVINIITRKNQTKKIAATAGLAGGSYGTAKGNAGISGNAGIVNYSLQYSHIHADGFSSAYDKTDSKTFDRDGYRQDALLGNIGFKVSQHLSAKLFGQFSSYKTDLDAGAFTDEKDYTSKSKNILAGAGLVYQVLQWTFNINYQYNKVSRSYLDDSVYRSNPSFYYSSSKYEGLTHYAELYGSRKWKNAELVAGIDYRLNKTNQDYFSYGIYGPYSTSLKDSLAKMNQISPYASLLLKTNNGLGVEIGGRWNHHSLYGNNFTCTFNPFYHVTKELKVFANFYSAFKTPTLYQLFDPFSGNKNLQPEKTNSIEAGADFTTGSHFYARAVYFYGNIKNAIEYITVDPVNYISMYTNVNHQKNNGVELELSKQINKWDFAANYTYTKGSTTSPYDAAGNKLSSDTTYNNLYRIPKSAFNFSAGVQATSQLFVNAKLHAAGQRWEPVYGSAPIPLSAYYTIDFSAEYRFTKAVKAFVDFKNITNQLYFDTYGYNSRRFNCMAGVTFNF